MSASRNFIKNIIVIFVWVWTVYIISVHLSSVETEFHNPHSRLESFAPTQAAHVYLASKEKNPKEIPTLVKEKVFKNPIRLGSYRAGRLAVFPFFRLNKFTKTNIKKAPLDADKKKPKMTCEEHNVEEDKVKISQFRKRKKKRRIDWYMSGLRLRASC